MLTTTDAAHSNHRGSRLLDSSPDVFEQQSKKFSFIKQVDADGHDGLQMLIEDVSTQHKRTVKYMLEDVIQEKDKENCSKNVQQLKDSLMTNMNS